MVSRDASTVGYSVVHNYDWVAGFFNSSEVPNDVHLCKPYHMHWLNVSVQEQYKDNINVLVIPILLAVNRFGRSWSGRTVTWYSDIMQVVHIVNKGSSNNKYCMEVLRYIFWWSVFHNFHLKCKHVPGKSNIIPDYLSRVGHGGSIFKNDLPICCRRAAATGQGDRSRDHHGVEQEYPSNTKQPVENLSPVLQ